MVAKCTVLYYIVNKGKVNNSKPVMHFVRLAEKLSVLSVR